MEEIQMVLIAHYHAPTVEGGKFLHTKIVPSSMSVEQAHKWAQKNAGAAILEKIEISMPRS